MVICAAFPVIRAAVVPGRHYAVATVVSGRAETKHVIVVSKRNNCCNFYNVSHPRLHGSFSCITFKPDVHNYVAPFRGRNVMHKMLTFTLVNTLF